MGEYSYVDFCRNGKKCDFEIHTLLLLPAICNPFFGESAKIE